MAHSPFEASPLPAAVERALQDMRAAMRSGFDALGSRMDETNTHLRELNGRTRKNEDNLARHDERIKTLFRQERRSRDDDPPGDDHRHERAECLHPEGGDKRGLTERDVRIFIAGAGAVVAVLTFLFKIWPLLAKAFAP